MRLKGKKIACFLALPHHTRFFITLRDKIKKLGGDILFLVTLSEYPYELDLEKRGFSYRFFTDYMTDEIRQKIKSSTSELLDTWAMTSSRWDGFGRWPIFKQSWFLEAIVEEYFCIERFIEVERPDMFMAHHECNRWGQVIGHLCYKKSIPFVTFQEGDYHGDYMGHTIHTQYTTADLLWGERTREVLKSYKCSMDKIVLIGNTHIESAIKTYSDSTMIADVKRDINIPIEKKVLLFLVDIKYAGIGKKEEWEKLLQGLNNLAKEAILIFKWHPATYKTSFEHVKEIFKELYPDAILLDTYEPYKLVAISDYCVTMGKTTLAIEALAFGKPLFAMPTPDTFEDYYVKIGVAQTLFPYGDWTNILNTIAHGVPQGIQDNVKKYLAHYFYKLDGKSNERAIDILSYVLECRQQKAKTTPTLSLPRQGGGIKGGGRWGKDKGSGSEVKGRVSFIIPSGHEQEPLLATLTSLSQNVRYPDWEVIIVINDENIKEILSGISGDVKIVEVNGDNLSYLYNKGAEASTGEYLIFIRPGIVYFKDDGLIEAMNGGIAGVPLKNIDMTPYCFGIGFDFNSTPYMIKEEIRRHESNPLSPPFTKEGQEGIINHEPYAVGGGLLGIHRGVYEIIDGFDEGIANHLTEADVCLSVKDKGYSVKYLPDCLAFNYKKTFLGEDVSNEQWKNRVKFFAKWVGRLPKDEDFLSFTKELMKV
ncbi:MAG: hypothetical protein A2035_07450 [Nitrospirae bacterium GWA2_42_11]|nr:MAG: hypothetical protein A2035_07450 [Nitrospirae bacterium GWA2_42_11]